MRSSSHSKATKHPKLHEVEYQFNDGRSIKLYSSMGKDIFHAGDWPFDTHPAWTKSTGNVNRSAARFAKFRDRFGDLFDGDGSSE